MSKNEDKEIKWYESANIITSLIIGVILVSIICSQSFAIVGKRTSMSIFSSVINHNSIYLLALVYFIVLKTKFGKKYFNYLNAFLMIVYFLATVTSLLTLIQSFSLITILSFLINLLLIIYLLHTMFRDTYIWKDLKLGNSPFNELSNDNYYYALFVLVVISLVVNLISTVVISGLFITIFDAIYILLFGRYIYLYREYLDYNKIDSDNEGNFDDIRANISSDLGEVKDTFNDISEGISKKANEILDKTDIDEKIVDTAKKVKESVSDKVSEVLDKTDIDEKIADTAKKVKKTVSEKVSNKKDETETTKKKSRASASKKSEKKVEKGEDK